MLQCLIHIGLTSPVCITFLAMPTSKTWKHPADDERFDATAYKSHNDKDPRSLGAGPCENKHLVALVDT